MQNWRVFSHACSCSNQGTWSNRDTCVDYIMARTTHRGQSRSQRSGNDDTNTFAKHTEPCFLRLEQEGDESQHGGEEQRRAQTGSRVDALHNNQGREHDEPTARSVSLRKSNSTHLGRRHLPKDSEVGVGILVDALAHRDARHAVLAALRGCNTTMTM